MNIEGLQNVKYIQYEAKDFKSDQYVRWCPGCGDHAVLNALQKAMAQYGCAPHNTAVISGIGCSSRLPYYMNTYGFHTIHGRGAAIASGVKIANPDLCVWLATGDGDCLAIGGNHFIHAVRRNIDINILLLNNKIYGLTKGQYSPTSDRGFVSKSSPQGTVEEPFHPVELAFGARATFFARGVDVDMANSSTVMLAAAKHKGTSVVEILQNCIIFNDKIHNTVSSKDDRLRNTIMLKHGEKMLFGENNSQGIVLDGFTLKAVTIGEDGYTIDHVLIHDAHEQDSTLHLRLGLMTPENGLPIALGVIRDVEALVYEQELEKQMDQEKQKHSGMTLTKFLKSKNTWEVK